MTAGFLVIQPNKGANTIAALYRTRAKRRFMLALSNPNDIVNKTKLYTVEVKPGKDAETLGGLLQTLNKAPGHFTVKVKRKTATFNTEVHAESGIIRFESKGMTLTYTPADSVKADNEGAMMLLSVVGMLVHGDAGNKFSVKIENGSAGGFADVVIKDVVKTEAKPEAKPESKPASKTTAPTAKAKAKPASEKADSKPAAPPAKPAAKPSSAAQSDAKKTPAKKAAPKKG